MCGVGLVLHPARFDFWLECRSEVILFMSHLIIQKNFYILQLGYYNEYTGLYHLLSDLYLSLA
jgi:hypothetical protein